MINVNLPENIKANKAKAKLSNQDDYDKLKPAKACRGIGCPMVKLCGRVREEAPYDCRGFRRMDDNLWECPMFTRRIYK